MACIHSQWSLLWYTTYNNGDNNWKANNVAKVAEKIKGNLLDEYGGVQPPPPLHSQSGYNPDQHYSHKFQNASCIDQEASS